MLLLHDRSACADNLREIGDRQVGFSNGTLNAQSSGLATRSSGRPKWKIPNGLGSEFIFGAPQFPGGEDAISWLG
jgi:hypothetical protein